jgi:S1-C subfamily serine protease
MMVGALALAAAPDARAELDIEAILAPLIALEARIPEDATSAKTLGTERGGTGIVIDAAGLVVTVGYLLLEAETVELLPQGPGGPRIPADVVAWDQRSGLGLVRARVALGIPPMPLGRSATVHRDDAVLAASWEREASLVPSYVADRRAFAGYWEYLLDDAIYVSPIHPAFAGAALIGLDGRLVGIGAFAQLEPIEEMDAMHGVFIPVDLLTTTLADLLLDGRVSDPPRPWLGLYCNEGKTGLSVLRLAEGGPAALAGIRPRDEVVAVEGVPVTTLEGLYRRLWSVAAPGDRVAVAIRRDGLALVAEVETVDRYEFLARRRRWVPGAGRGEIR